MDRFFVPGSAHLILFNSSRNFDYIQAEESVGLYTYLTRKTAFAHFLSSRSYR